MGKVSLNSLQFPRGVRYLELAARNKPGDTGFPLYAAACEIRIKLGDRRGAEQDLNTLLQKGASLPKIPSLVEDLAQLHISGSDWGATIALINLANGKGFQSAKLSYQLGFAYYKQGQLATAQSYFSQASGKSAAAAAALYYQAEILYKAFEMIS